MSTNPNYPAGVSDRDIDGEPRVEDVSERDVEITISVTAHLIGGRVYITDMPEWYSEALRSDVKAALLKAHADEKAYQRDETEGVR